MLGLAHISSRDARGSFFAPNPANVFAPQPTMGAMYPQQPVRLAVISGNGGRPSIFGASVSQSGTFHPQYGTVVQAPRAMGYARLGDLDHPENAREWYERAKAGIARFDLLLKRTAGIANKTERERIMSWVGRATDEDSPMYRYTRVKGDIVGDVERFTPPNYGAYDVERRQNRVDKLWDYNGEFKNMVENAEQVYGILPGAQIITKERIVEVPGKGPDLTIPLAIGGVAVATALGFLLFKG